ncbi:RDD family protein [Demetria terragena]|uniref:RDD family protein n=1 Tax=Demetria terragena TaxID=63959 RepID=UPI000364FDF0|nr:RDD family protein [Demetria terragena]
MSNAPSEAPAEEFRPLRGAEREELVTGEAVLLDIPPASLPQRIGSGLVDLIQGYVGFWGSLWLMANAFGTTGIAPSEILIGTLILLATVFWFVGLPVAIQTATRGLSLGHLITKTRTVRDDGGPIVFRHALVRGLVGYVEIYALSGVPALVSAMSTSKGRRIGDLAAGTYVVREATHIKLQLPATMPPGLERWATGADMAPLPDGLALAIRQVLERQSTLSPTARTAVTQDLLNRTLPLVSPAPPHSAPADAVLAAILAERRRRDEQRLQSEHEIRNRFLPADRL